MLPNYWVIISILTKMKIIDRKPKCSNFFIETEDKN